MKAKFIGKYRDRDFVYMEYEYRGHTYEVYENRAKGNEPLTWQHRSEQARIDRMIEIESKGQHGEKFDIDEIWKILEWD